MTEHPYNSETLEQPYRSLFEQLVAEFPEYEVWQRHENFGRWLSAALVNKTSGQSLSVPIVHAGTRRTWPYHRSELEMMREMLLSIAAEEQAS